MALTEEQRNGSLTDGREAMPVETGRVSVDQNGHHLHDDREVQQQLAQQTVEKKLSESNSFSFPNPPAVVLDIQQPPSSASEKGRDLKTSKGPLPITLKFEDVDYIVTIKSPTAWFEFNKWSYKSLIPNLFSKKRNDGTIEKQILHGVSGVVKPGEFLAMLGPSGSGKTTLLNVLGGRSKGHLTGKVLFNDSDDTKGMKRRTGFVTQDDVLLPHLTVRETLVYAAYLRLPSKEFSKHAKVQRAEDVMSELGLERCKDTVIGGPFLRGVSGGERKRVSIGHEMLIDPSLLLLDEPTSGLDSTTALKIIQTLQNLAKQGRTVVTTIHQPSSVIYNTFTKLLLLSEGHTLFYGLASVAMTYFESQGFRPAFQTNPADFLLDIANGIVFDAEDGEGATRETQNASLDPFSKGVILRKLREAYNKTLLTRTRSSITQTAQLTEEEYKASRQKREWPTTFFEQFSVLMRRGMKQRRHDIFEGLKVTQVTSLSIMCGLVWWQSSPDNIQDQAGLLFFFTTMWGFFPVYCALFTFPRERQMLIKERTSGMYRLSAYFFSRTIGDLPLELVMPTVSITVIYWMAGLKKTPGAFFFTLLILLLNVLVTQGFGLLLGAAFMDVKQATTFCSIILLTFQLTAGYYTQNMPIWIRWMKYLSCSYYTYKLQLSAQYSDKQTYPCETGRCRIVDYPAVKSIGVDHVGTSLMALLIMMFGYRFLTYLSLRRMKL